MSYVGIDLLPGDPVAHGGACLLPDWPWTGPGR